MNDYNAESVASFDRNAAKYADKYFALRDYDRYYQLLVEQLPTGPSAFLDLACGPGNVAAYVRQHRPEASILCIDRSLQMLAEVERRIAGVEVLAADCRELGALTQRFDAAAFFFGLSYFDDGDAARVLAQLHGLLLHGAPLLLATVAGEPERSGVQTNAAGDRVFSFYRRQADIEHLMRQAGFELIHASVIPSPANATVQSSDVVLLARKAL